LVWNFAIRSNFALDIPSAAASSNAVGGPRSPPLRWTLNVTDGNPESNRICFITGGSGFVGSALSAHLADRGWLVRTDPLRLLTEPAKWQSALQSVQCLVHLAAHVHQMGANSTEEAAYTKINLEGSRFVAEQAARAGLQRLIFLSSIKVNGEGGEQAYRGTDTPDPRDAYGRSKLAAELAIRDVCDAGGVQCVIIRPPLVYGAKVKANFRRLMRWVDAGLPLPFRSIENRRSLVGLSNLISFIDTCMQHPRAASKIWLVADDEPKSTPQLLRRIAHHMNRRSLLYPFPPAWLRKLAVPLGLGSEMSRLCDSLLVDASPARLELGWQPAVTFDEEIARTVASFQDEKKQ
jgi:UDP-glucose 4-epimerase